MTLAPVQMEAITRADGRRGFAYFMEMGLGKTLTVLTEFKALQMCNAVEPLVVICPTASRAAGTNEIEKHRTGLTALRLREPSARSRWPPTSSMCSSSTTRRCAPPTGLEAIIKFVEDHSAYLALDESIKLKNRLSKQTKAIIGAMHKQPDASAVSLLLFAYIRLLSGKPMTPGAA